MWCAPFSCNRLPDSGTATVAGVIVLWLWPSAAHVSLATPTHPPRCRPYRTAPAGGLPASWLSKSRILATVQYLDLSSNFLGYDADRKPLAWCRPAAAAGLPAGSGWCPEGKPLPGTAASLEHLNLADNGLSGACMQSGLAAVAA